MDRTFRSGAGFTIAIGAGLALLLAACGGEDEPHGSRTPPGDTPVGCAAGEIAGADGACAPVGIQGCAAMFLGDDALCHPRVEACPAGQIPKLDAGCVAVGLTGCDAAFLGDDGLCHPSLSKCPDGTFAVADRCLPVDGPDGCGEGAWGSVADVSGTVYVDPSFTGPTRDGSKARPLATLVEALAAAPRGGRVALAAGVYSEPIRIRRPVEIVGRCASLVRIAWTPPDDGGRMVVQVDDAGDVALRGVEIDGGGEGWGVVAFGTTRLALDRVVVRDAASVAVAAPEAPTTLSIANSWLDHTVLGTPLGGRGVLVGGGATATVDHVAITRCASAGVSVGQAGSALHLVGSSIEGTLPARVAELGTGVAVSEGAQAIVDASAIVDNRHVGVFASGDGSTATVHGALIERTGQAYAPGTGFGTHALLGGRVTVEASAIVDNWLLGVSALGAGAEATVRSTLVRGSATAGSAQAELPIRTSAGGVFVSTGARATIADSAVWRSRGTGVVVQEGSEATIAGSIVEGTTPWIGPDSIGVAAPQGKLTVTSSAIVENTGFGLSAAGVQAQLIATENLIEGTLPTGNGEYGVGAIGGGGMRVELGSNLVTRNRYIGLAFTDDAEGRPDVTITGGVIEQTESEAATDEVGVGIFAENGALRMSSVVLRDNRLGGALFSGTLQVTAQGLLVDGAIGGNFTRKDTGVRYEDVGDGLLVTDAATLDVSDARVTRCARAGILYDRSSGQIARVTAFGNRIGLVVQGDPQPMVGEGVRLDDNTERAQLTGGDLAVPDRPSAIP